MPSIMRYVLRQLAAVTVIVTATLVCAIWLTQSLRFVELIVNRGLELSSFLHLTMLLLPNFLSVILPIALFTAILFTYNRLASDSELVVLRALGLGPGQVARPALWTAVTVTAIGYSLSLFFLPLSYRQFKDLEFNVRSDYTSVLLREGAFNTVSDGITVYIRSREPNGELRGLIVHDNRERERPVTLLAERGSLATTSEGPRVIMVNGNRQQVERDNGRLSLLYFDRYSVDLGKVSQPEAARWREPRERFLHELMVVGDSPLDRAFAPKLRAEFHNRLVAPLYALVFALIGLAAMLSGEFSRRGQGKRILTTVVIVLALQSIAIGLNNAVVKTPLLIPLVYAIPFAALAGALWWLHHPPRRRRTAEAWVPTG